MKSHNNDQTLANSKGETKEARINWSVQNRKCAYCGEDLKEKKLFGSGSFKDGLFGSLDCYTNFHGKKSFKMSQKL